MKRTQAERVNTIAKELGYPQVEVKRIIDKYRESLIKSALDGETVEVLKVFTINPVLYEDGTKTLRGSVSKSLRDLCKQREQDANQE